MDNVGITPLKAWLKANRVPVSAAAKAVGCSRPHLSMIVNGRHPAGKLLANRIVAFCNGEVDRDSLLYLAKSKPT